MTKFKVKASQKENWRYIAFRVLSESKPSEQELTRAVINSVTRLLGEIGASETNVWLLEYDKNKQNGIIKCSHDAQTRVLGAITTITKIGENPAALIALGTSGTIKKATQKYLSAK